MASEAEFWATACELVMHESRLERLLKAERKQAVEAATPPPPAQGSRKKRKKEEARRMPRNDDFVMGDVRRWRLDAEKSPWWKLIGKEGVRDVGTRAYKSFRRKFRLPLVEVEKLVAWSEDAGLD